MSSKNDHRLSCSCEDALKPYSYISSMAYKNVGDGASAIIKGRILESMTIYSQVGYLIYLCDNVNQKTIVSHHKNTAYRTMIH